MFKRSWKYFCCQTAHSLPEIPRVPQDDGSLKRDLARPPSFICRPIMNLTRLTEQGVAAATKAGRDTRMHTTPWESAADRTGREVQRAESVHCAARAPLDHNRPPFHEVAQARQRQTMRWAGTLHSAVITQPGSKGDAPSARNQQHQQYNVEGCFGRPRVRILGRLGRQGHPPTPPICDYFDHSPCELRVCSRQGAGLCSMARTSSRTWLVILGASTSRGTFFCCDCRLHAVRKNGGVLCGDVDKAQHDRLEEADPQGPSATWVNMRASCSIFANSEGRFAKSLAEFDNCWWWKRQDDLR